MFTAARHNLWQMHKFPYRLHTWKECKILIKDSGISFMYNKNSNGPKIEPCEIPQTIFLGDEIWPFTVHCCSRLVR